MHSNTLNCRIGSAFRSGIGLRFGRSRQREWKHADVNRGLRADDGRAADRGALRSRERSGGPVPVHGSAARAAEMSAGDDPGVGSALIEQARRRASPVLVDVLSRYPLRAGRREPRRASNEDLGHLSADAPLRPPPERQRGRGCSESRSYVGGLISGRAVPSGRGLLPGRRPSWSRPGRPRDDVTPGQLPGRSTGLLRPLRSTRRTGEPGRAPREVGGPRCRPRAESDDGRGRPQMRSIGYQAPGQVTTNMPRGTSRRLRIGLRYA